jgi:hypothetical protein
MGASCVAVKKTNVRLKNFISIFMGIKFHSFLNSKLIKSIYFGLWKWMIKSGNIYFKYTEVT